MSCGVGCRRGSDPTLLWLWSRLGATTPIRPLAWEPPYATGAVLKRKRKRKKKATDKKREAWVIKNDLWKRQRLLGCG